MPAKSKSQQRAAGMALAAKEGKMKVSDLKGAAKSMYKMSKEDLEKYAGTKHKDLPKKKKKEESMNESEDPYKLEPYVFDIIDELTRKGFSEDIIDNIILNDPATNNMIYSAMEHNISPRYVANELNAVYNDYINENKNKNMKKIVKESLNEGAPYDEFEFSENFQKKYGYLEPSLVLRIQSMVDEGPKMGEKVIVEEYDGDYYINGHVETYAVLTKKEDGLDQADWVIYSDLSMDEIYELVGLNESLNEQEKLPKLKRFEDVEEGNQAIDYNGDEYEVVDKITYDGINIDSVIQFLREYDSTGAMQSELKEMIGELEDEDVEIQMLAVYTAEDEATYVFTYGDGAYVPRD